MNRIYLLSIIVSLFIVSCTPSETTQQDTAEQATEIQNQAEITTSDLYETKVVNGELPSPLMEMSGNIGSEAITVGYGSPSVKERAVWGELVPYNQVWRTGANGATTFETAVDLKVQGETLVAGKYGLFTIPSESGEWIVIFNSIWEQWGAYEYDDSKDVLRVNTTPIELEASVERLEFVMEDNNLVLRWEKLALPIQVEL
ncbi:MAG: hypothetical protein ACJAUH_002943 [Saprospiraceae bacterium]|jgi:hypothetical protein